jgi:hypothetical protein
MKQPPSRVRHSRSARLIAGAAAILIFVSIAACDSDDGGDATPATPTATKDGTATPDANENDELTLHGNLTLDGAPLEARFLGVRVLRDGLSSACQNNIPEVIGGRYEIDVATDAEVRGCGAPGAQLLLWTFVDDTYYFATTTAPWPASGSVLPFDAAFASDMAQGASTPVTEFKGRLFAADGTRLPPGTVVEAFVEDVRCGVTSLRPGDVSEGLYTLVVAGPDSIAGCAANATLTFRLDAKPAAETAVNDLGSGSGGHELDLTVK